MNILQITFTVIGMYIIAVIAILIIRTLINKK